MLLAFCQSDVFTLFHTIFEDLEDLVGEWVCGVGFVE
jgi:hypothetical protein